jgi:hypothetical protein
MEYQVFALAAQYDAASQFAFSDTENSTSLQSSISLKKRWQIAKVRMIMGASSWVQGLIIDIREPFSAFMPFAAKKFQLDSQIEQFGLFSVNNKKEPLPMDKSIFGLDLPAETEFILANKSQPIQEAPKPADDGPRKTSALFEYHTTC